MRHIRPILLVEDDQVDIMLIQRAFKQNHILNELPIARDGEEALEYLRGDKEKPCIILLDLNMPRMNGLEFLKIVKQDDNFKRIPVVVFTTSQGERDKIDSFNLGVAGYMVKPVDFVSFANVIKAIDLYWTLSELPPDKVQNIP